MVTEKEIETLLKKGATTVEEVILFSGVGSGCGRCKSRVVELVQKELEKKPVEKQLRLF